MPRQLRHRQVRPLEIPLYHALSRCARKMRLTDSPKRKEFMLGWLKTLHSVFAVEVCRFALMGNHFHLVLRVDPAMAQAWGDREVVARWVRLHPPRDAGHRPLDGDALALWIDNQARIPEYVAKLRQKLADLGQFMKDFKQRVAEVFNKEDKASGAFWAGRYSCVPLESDSQVLACMTYVDLNPHAAKLCDKPEDDPHTSLHESVKSRNKEAQVRAQLRLPPSEKAPAHAIRTAQFAAEAKKGHDPLRAPHLIETIPDAERHAWTVPIGPTRHARKSLFPDLRLEDYLRLVDFAARKIRQGKTPLDDATADILERTRLRTDHWLAELGRWIGRKVVA